MSQESQEEMTVEQVRALASLQQFAGDSELRSIGSFEDALALAEQVHGSILDIAEELGTGFAVLEDKARLENKEFVLVHWRFNAGEFGSGFVSAGVVTREGGKYIINDGSTGIYQQLLTLSQNTQRFGGVLVPTGLRQSTYATCIECGRPMSRDEIECSNDKCDYEGDKRGQGQTFYLNLSAAAN